MKTLKNKTTDIKNGENNLTYADLIIASVNAINPKEGITVKEMSNNMRVIEVAQAGGNSLNFEDADVSTLQRKVNEMKWVIQHKDIIQFSEDINNLTT